MYYIPTHRLLINTHTHTHAYEHIHIYIELANTPPTSVVSRTNSMYILVIVL